MRTEAIFQTRRLILHPLKRDDLNPLFEILSDPEAMRYFDVCRPMTIEETADQLESWIEHQNRHGFIPGLILFKQNLEIAGYGGVAYYPETETTGPELIYIFRKVYWGKGLATEFAAATIEYAFSELKVDRILATVRPENKPSIRVLEKVGMALKAFAPEDNRFLYCVEKPPEVACAQSPG